MFSPQFSIIILSSSSRRYVVRMFPALFYFEICVFEKMNQLLSPMWPLFTTARQHCFKQSAEDCSATEKVGVSLSDLFPVLSWLLWIDILELFFLREQESDSGKVKRQTSGGHPSLRLQWASAVAERSALIRFNKADVHRAAYHNRGKPVCS